MGLRLFLASLLAPKEIQQSKRYESLLEHVEEKTIEVQESSQTRIALGVMKLLFEGSEANLLRTIKELGAKAYPAQIHRTLFPKGTSTTVSRTDIAWFMHLLDAMDVTRSKVLTLGRNRIRQYTLTDFGEMLLTLYK